MPNTIHVVAGIGIFIFTTALLFAYSAVESLDAESDNFVHNVLEPSETNLVKKESVEPISEEVQRIVQEMRLPNPLQTVDTSLSYDIHKCPPTIPKNYPQQWSVIDVLSHWHPDETTVPSHIHQGLCELDWTNPQDRIIAERYREAELPFLIHNHPQLWKASEQWSHREYLSKQLGKRKTRNEHSTNNNHMPYWKDRGSLPVGWKPPTENVELTFDEWYEKAVELETSSDPIHTDHFYFRLNGEADPEQHLSLRKKKKKKKSELNSWIYDDLPMFLPVQNFFFVDPDGYRGINCRLGSKGTIAEMHYDFSRNFIVLLGGRKRYVLADPTQCPNLELFPSRHPSARHSSVDWSNPNDWHTGKFPQAQVNEVVLQAGDILYLPTAWFHFIVSLNKNYQCNARSGITYEHKHTISACGFS